MCLTCDQHFNNHIYTHRYIYTHACTYVLVCSVGNLLVSPSIIGCNRLALTNQLSVILSVRMCRNLDMIGQIQKYVPYITQTDNYILHEL